MGEGKERRKEQEIKYGGSKECNVGKQEMYMERTLVIAWAGKGGEDEVGSRRRKRRKER